MGVRFQSSSAVFNQDGSVVFGCPHTCSNCSGATLDYIEATFSGVILCSCVSFFSPTNTSAALSYLNSWTPNTTFRLRQVSASYPCAYNLIYANTLQRQNFNSVGNCTGSPNSTNTDTIYVVAKVGAASIVVSIGTSYSVDWDPVVASTIFYASASFGGDCTTINSTIGNANTACSGIAARYGTSGSVTITSP